MRRRLHVYYSGAVQGVGFRYTAQEIASDLGIEGWVRNLRDGRVEILADGEEKALNNFLARIKNEMGRYIHDLSVRWGEVAGEFNGFEIRFE